MSYQSIAFQLFNLNDYGIKLFPSFKIDTLYLAKFQIVEKFPEQHDDIDEGSSQRFDKLLLIPSKNDKVQLLKNFPFTALLRDELVHLNITGSIGPLENGLPLFNVEYNYILILYFDTQETVNKLLNYLTNTGLQSINIDNIDKFIKDKEDEIDEKLYKESHGQKRLQKKINPKHSKEIPLLSTHIKILEDDETYKDVYLKLIKQFDDLFLHSENANFEYDSKIQKNIV
ncbi:hypothetical protein BN7_6011 [Wickerhamomyces ciferrii]|uniref:Uncharacterized protein n=1 Tax=Wickerhamomyces ciferrii (strain ATCC 14091 / BCRC 22168 / CBS 111 / JCM 3599 / NBRC 0793 / NRRL Y-1031 F-60-10) TaxID=1206466 RepID=K0KWM0_WICCF|nr:uncharacterized protein BN7_6011 [Wickerhamomyces ciferrii]CCH46417.1 hypothetical protein BN7_6011 [Wickerhamomyces ciferrii]